MNEDSEPPAEEPVVVPITSDLDLHTFQPSELPSLLPEYFRECRIKGLLVVRVVHGKGTGTLRERVHAMLRRMPEVVSFRLGDENSGEWGATVVRLLPWQEEEDSGKKAE